SATIASSASDTLPAGAGGFTDEALRPTSVSSDDTSTTIDLEGNPPDAATAFEDRYQRRRMLGAGGMGEVRLAKDRRVGREVALKVMRARSAHDPESRMR